MWMYNGRPEEVGLMVRDANPDERGYVRCLGGSWQVIHEAGYYVLTFALAAELSLSLYHIWVLIWAF